MYRVPPARAWCPAVGAPRAQVKRIALANAADVYCRMAELAQMMGTLQRLSGCCHGDERPDCPILDELAEGPAAAQPAPQR